MLNQKTIAVVVPAYNEETQIEIVLDSMPDFVDRIIVVDDKSKDKTKEVLLSYMQKERWGDLTEIAEPITELSENIYNYADRVLLDRRKNEEKLYKPYQEHYASDSRVVCIEHLENGGVGAAIATGYRWCRDHNIDCTAVMAGDGQMDPSELEKICMPVVQETVDYVKGNRLIHAAASVVVPKVRYIGNSILSILTKAASGYWHVSDTQTGYTAISLEALEGIDLHKIYPRYGMPNDILVKLNIGFFKITEVAIKPVYNVGEQSKMKIRTVIPKVSWLLVKSFFKRMIIKYFFRAFHPLFLCYFTFFTLLVPDAVIFGKLVYDLVEHQNVNDNYLMLGIFLGIMTIQFLLFGMWFDMQDNEKLHVE